MSRPWINRIIGIILSIFVLQYFLERGGIFSLPGANSTLMFTKQIIILLCALTLLRPSQRALQLISSGILFISILIILSISLFQIFGEGFMSNTNTQGSLISVRELVFKGPALSTNIATRGSGSFSLIGGRKATINQNSGKLTLIESSQRHPLQKGFTEAYFDLGGGAYSGLTFTTRIGSTQGVFDTGFFDTLAIQHSMGSIQLSLSGQQWNKINLDLGAGSIWLKGLSHQAYQLRYYNNCAGIGDSLQGLEVGSTKNTYISTAAKAFSGALPLITVNMVCGSLVIE